MGMGQECYEDELVEHAACDLVPCDACIERQIQDDLIYKNGKEVSDCTESA